MLLRKILLPAERIYTLSNEKYSHSSLGVFSQIIIKKGIENLSENLRF